MNLKLIITLILFFFISNISNAFDIKQVNDAKIVSKASYAVNDTNLVDKENAETLLESVLNLNEALKKKESEIIKKK